MPRIKENILPLDLQYQVKRLLGTQRKCAAYFNVTEGAVSAAINNDPLLKSLRKKIIDRLNHLETKKAV